MDTPQKGIALSRFSVGLLPSKELDPGSVSGARNHTAFSRIIESRWRAAMTWSSRAFQVRLGGFAEGYYTQPLLPAPSGALVPASSTAALADADERKKCEHVSFF